MPPAGDQAHNPGKCLDQKSHHLGLNGVTERELLPHRELGNDKEEEYVWAIDLVGYLLVTPLIAIKVDGNHYNIKQAGLLMAETLQE